METWQIVTAANLVVAAAYVPISYIILSGMIRTGQLGSNKLGLATGLSFFTYAVHR
jgi:hypothetical protein